MPQVTIVIPCYNEAERLPVSEYQRFLSGCEAQLLFVNDGSTDTTLSILQQLQQLFPAKVNVMNLEQNSGKAEAVRCGMLEVAGGTDNGIIGFMDADLATPFEEVDYFLEAFRDTRLEFVFGARIARIGANIQRYQVRHYLGRIMATLVSNYLHLPVNDTQCGAKFFHACFARQLFAEPFVSRWLFDVEIFKRILLMGIRVESCSLELPLHTWTDKGGSKLVMRDFMKLPLDFYKMVSHYQQKRNSVSIQLLYQDSAV